MVKKNNYGDKFNYSFFCDKDVTHFVRNIITWHSAEIIVQKILLLPSKSKERFMKKKLMLLTEQAIHYMK